MKESGLILAAKCAPDDRIFSDIAKAGIKAVELFVSKKTLFDPATVSAMCRQYPFRYAIHANDDSFQMKELAQFAKEINAEIVVFHNIYWESEWPGIIGFFKGVDAALCLENVQSTIEPIKFIRTYGLRRCLDFEHFQIECSGLNDEVLPALLSQTSHVHLTGYVYGSALWHTHIHYSSAHNLRVLDMLRRHDYSGFVVSEAKVAQQTYEEFKSLKLFFDGWNSKNS